MPQPEVPDNGQELAQQLFKTVHGAGFQPLSLLPFLFLGRCLPGNGRRVQGRAVCLHIGKRCSSSIFESFNTDVLYRFGGAHPYGYTLSKEFDFPPTKCLNFVTDVSRIFCDLSVEKDTRSIPGTSVAGWAECRSSMQFGQGTGYFKVPHKRPLRISLSPDDNE
jgi:hypothetical protein